MSATRPPSAMRSSSAPLPRLRPPTTTSGSRNLGELGCVQSFLPLYSMLTSQLNADLRGFSELCDHATFLRSCQDR
ncbi:hypothetical protein LINPERPRIM_LOCUS13899 [Linum perenne]